MAKGHKDPNLPTTIYSVGKKEGEEEAVRCVEWGGVSMLVILSGPKKEEKSWMCFLFGETAQTVYARPYGRYAQKRKNRQMYMVVDYTFFEPFLASKNVGGRKERRNGQLCAGPRKGKD